MENSVYILEDRAILYINGLDSKDFLQNLITNDINKVSENSSCFEDKININKH
jgi:folate-binding Fe-S cluster repair protein YgfZ